MLWFCSHGTKKITNLPNTSKKLVGQFFGENSWHLTGTFWISDSPRSCDAFGSVKHPYVLPGSQVVRGKPNSQQLGWSISDGLGDHDLRNCTTILVPRSLSIILVQDCFLDDWPIRLKINLCTTNLGFPRVICQRSEDAPFFFLRSWLAGKSPTCTLI